MALTATQKIQIKKHLGMSPLPDDTHLDLLLSPLQDGGVIEAELTASITECETNLAALKTAEGAIDDLREGAGARFDGGQVVEAKKSLYRRSVDNLARIIGVAPASYPQIKGFFTV